MENGTVNRPRRGRAVPGKVSEPQEKEAEATAVGQGDPDTVFADAVLARWQDAAHKLHKRQHGVTIATIRAENQEKERLEKERAINTWSKVIFGIGPESRDLPASRLIAPLSPFGLGWMILMTLALFYTALLTPPTVAFHWLDEACDDIPTLMADTVVDSLFLVDILLTFVTGRLLAGDYVDDWRAVMKDYLKGGFWFDCATSIPVSYFEHVKNASCKKAAQAAEAAGTDVTSVSGSAGDLRLLRVLKPMRLLKIARVFKLGRLTQILDLIADVCDISPKAGKTFKVMMSLLAVIHILACLWWLMVVLGMTEDEIYAFLDAQPWGSQFGDDGHVHKIHTEAGRFEAYVISCYLVTMTLTTVGYGDITANNTTERIGYVVLFIFGAFVWGTLLAQVGEIHQSATKQSEERLDRIQNMIEFLRENDCPPRLRTRIVQWTRFSENTVSTHLSKKLIMQQLPTDLRHELLQFLYKPLICKVPLFAYVLNSVERHSSADACITNVLDKLEYKSFAPDEILIDFPDPADKMVIIVEGKVHCQFEHPTLSFSPMDLKRGDFIGDFAILGDQDWGSSSCFEFEPNSTGEVIEIHVQSVNQFVIVLELAAEDFQDSLSKAAYDVQEAVEIYRNQLEKRKSGEQLDGYQHKQLVVWELMVRKRLKKSRRESVSESHQGFGRAKWKVPVLKDTALKKPGSSLVDTAGAAEDWCRVDEKTRPSGSDASEDEGAEGVYPAAGRPRSHDAGYTGAQWSEMHQAGHDERFRSHAHADLTMLERNAVQHHSHHHNVHPPPGGGVFCSACGTRSLAGGPFCVACGTRLHTLAQDGHGGHHSTHFLASRANAWADHGKWEREHHRPPPVPANLPVEPSTTFSLRGEARLADTTAMVRPQQLPPAHDMSSCRSSMDAQQGMDLDNSVADELGVDFHMELEDDPDMTIKVVETPHKSPGKLRHPGLSASLRVHGKSFGICPDDDDDDALNSATWTLETSVARADSKSPCRDCRVSLQDVSASRELLLQASHGQLSARIEDLHGQVESTNTQLQATNAKLDRLLAVLTERHPEG